MRAGSSAAVMTVALCGLATLGGCGRGGTGAQATVTETMTATETVTVTATETVTVEAAAAEEAAEPIRNAAEPPFTVYEIGERFEFAESGLTVTEVTVGSLIATTDGTALEAAEGEQLILVKSRYENLGGSSVDLSCSGPLDLYIVAHDTEGREMEPVYDTHRIPGNQPCNQGLLSGQEADWNFAYRAIEGGEPMALEIVDTRNFADAVVVNLTDEPLRFDR